MSWKQRTNHHSPIIKSRYDYERSRVAKARGTRRRTSTTLPGAVHGVGGVPPTWLSIEAHARLTVPRRDWSTVGRRIDITGQSSCPANPFRSTPGGALLYPGQFCNNKTLRRNRNSYITVLTLMSAYLWRSLGLIYATSCNSACEKYVRVVFKKKSNEDVGK